MTPFQTSGTPIHGGTLSIATGAASSAVALNNANVIVVRIIATADAFVSFSSGYEPTAVADPTKDMFMAAGIPEYFFLPVNSKVAAIQSTGAGKVYVTPTAKNYATD